MNALNDIKIPLEADEEQIRLFVNCLFKYADPGTLVPVRSLPHDTSDRNSYYVRWPIIQSDLSGVVTIACEAATLTANDAKRLVFAPPIVTVNEAPPGQKQRAATENLANGLAITAELDSGNIPEQRRTLESLLGRATVIIASGGEWIDPETGEVHAKIHMHWRLSEPTRTPEEHQALRQARNLVALRVGADRTAIPLVHPLRWAGSWHTKAAPVLAKIISCHDDAEVHLSEVLEKLEKAVEDAGIDLVKSSNGPHASGKPQADIPLIKAAIPFIPNPDLSWKEWNELGAAIYNATSGSSEGLDLWIDWSQKSTKYVAGECQARWGHFHAHPFTRLGAGSLFWRAKMHGWVDPRARVKPSYNDEPDSGPDTHADAEGVTSNDADDSGAGDDGVEAAHDGEPVSDDVAKNPEPETAASNSAADAENITDLVLERALRRLSVVEFEAQREALAKKFNIRLRALDALRRKYEAAATKATKQAEADAKKGEGRKEREAGRSGAQDAHEDVDQMVSRFNDEYSVVNEDGKALVYQRGEDSVLKRRVFYRLSTSDFKTLHMNRRIEVGHDADGNPKMRSIGSVWLNHTERRQFIKGVIFDPSNQTAPGVLNLWEGFGVKPEPGDWSLMQAHIKDVICGGNAAHNDYLLNWTARLVQFPAQQGEVAVVLRGLEGCGKGTLAGAIKTIIGHHALGINNAKHLVGNFNQHLRAVIFLFADEAFFAGDKQHVGVLKSLITEPSLTIEAKYANAVEFPNYLHIMMASNEEWVVPADLRLRRFFVKDVLDTYVGNFAYFKKIREQLDAGGYAAMLHDLLNRDISDFNVRDVPQTEGLEQQRHLSLDTVNAWWFDCLERGYVFRSKLGLEDVLGVWDEHISTELLHASYTEFAKARNERHPKNRVHLGRYLSDLGGEAKRKSGGIVGERMAEDEATGFA